MATFTKRDTGYLVRVRLKGVTQTKTFKRMAEARAWAATVESDIAAGVMGTIPNKTFADLIERFINEHVVKLDGERQDKLRLLRVMKDPIAKVKLQDLNATHVSEWRDRRLKSVSAESVRREWSSLSHACQLAKQEWKWLRENPFREVKKPQKAQPRNRRFSTDEIESLLYACGYSRDEKPVSAQARVGAALLFAIETAMRAGEICALQWHEVDLEKRIATVSAVVKGARKTKRSRVVPLSLEAVRIIEQMRGNESVFDMAPSTLDALFRKAKARCLISDLHFHDSRHEATSRLAGIFSAMELARITGHKDLRQLMIYYNPTAGELASKLD
jgi:integrase